MLNILLIFIIIQLQSTRTQICKISDGHVDCVASGSRDWLRNKNRELLEAFEAPAVIHHEGRHCVPRLGMPLHVIDIEFTLPKIIESE
jgi:hypothetical protein